MSLFPAKPAIMEGGAKGTDANILKNNPAGDGREHFDVEARKKRDAEISQLVGLDNSVFMLVAALSRTDMGRKLTQGNGLLRRCIERFHLSSGKHRTDIVVRGEVSERSER